MKKEMRIEDVHWFLDLFFELGITVWLDGGWGVDALLGEQTRPHADLDIMVPASDSARLVDALFESGFKDVDTDDRVDENFVMGHPERGLIDFHVFQILAEGHGIYRPGAVDWPISKAELSATGTIGGRFVRCLTAEYQVRSHSGYILHPTDLHDVAALNKRFGVKLLEEHIRAINDAG